MKLQHIFVFAGLAASIMVPRAYAMDAGKPKETSSAVEQVIADPLPMRDLSRYAEVMDDIRIPLADALVLGVETRERRVAFPDRDIGTQSRKRTTILRDHRLDVFEKETLAGAKIRLRF